MDKPTLYMETTIPSYLLAEPSRNVISLARQDITRTWWKRDRARYAIFISEVVIQEAGRGDRKEVEKRREFLRPFPVLDATPEVRALIKLYLEKGVVPPETLKTPLISPLRAFTRWSICARGTSGIWRMFLHCGVCAN